MSRQELKRNDLAGAKKFYEQNKPITSSQAETLVMMQDDSKELITIMEKESWQIIQDDAKRPPSAAQRLMAGEKKE